MEKKRGTLYCVCNEADKRICEDCKKYKRIKPDHTLHCETWPRKACK
jgi:hypothetical protein